MPVRVAVTGIPDWVDAHRLLGEGDWSRTDDQWIAELERPQAADLSARLRGVGLGGTALTVDTRPSLKRNLIRAARTADARRRRDTTPGFLRPGTQVDDEGRMSLTPECLALALGRRAKGRSVVDATCGCGGNAIGFARAGCRVIAIERDAQRLAMARHNAAIYGVADRIDFVHGDAREVLTERTAELLFVDPPWGADWDRIRTTPAAVPLLATLVDRPGFESIWMKLPPSFDPATVPGASAQAWFGEAEGDRRRVKFVLLEAPGKALLARPIIHC